MTSAHIEFTTSKNIHNIIEFDKENKLWRLSTDLSKLYDYKLLEKVEVMEAPKSRNNNKNAIASAVLTAVMPMAAVQTANDVIIQVKIKLIDKDVLFIDVSKDYVTQYSDQYHKDKEVADEIKKAIRVLIRRNKSEI